MSLPFVVERGIYGKRLVLTGPWDQSVAEYLQREHIRELYLNHARGWRGTTLDFLAGLPALDAFSIIDFTINDVSPIHQLSDLRALELSTYCDTEVNFARFPTLERAVFYWRDGSDSLFDCVTLRMLFLHRYNRPLSQPFSRLSCLEDLSIANSDLREVESLAALKNVKFLGLYNLKELASLRGLDALVQLETLEINGCKRLGRIDELATLVNLRRLQLNDDGLVASLAPLRGASHLEEVLFYESTNIVDGNLSPLTELARLRHVSFQNRRHYSHKREQFPLASASQS